MKHGTATHIDVCINGAKAERRILMDEKEWDIPRMACQADPGGMFTMYYLLNFILSVN
jgi:hypothetical protein